MSGWASDWARLVAALPTLAWVVVRVLAGIGLFAASIAGWVCVYLPLELVTLGRARVLRRLFACGVAVAVVIVVEGFREAWSFSHEAWVDSRDFDIRTGR